MLALGRVVTTLLYATAYAHVKVFHILNNYIGNIIYFCPPTIEISVLIYGFRFLSSK